ncbi:hypothetical protein V8E55_009280 [Tylopilus felleus]
MAHISGAVYLVWALLTSMLGSLLVFHLWSFDRFRCLKWNQGPYAGAFKRLMMYSYLVTIPFIFTHAMGFAVIKYTYGFVVIPEVGVMPTPYNLWSQSAQNAIFPLYFSLALGWAFEIVIHLEELCFWLFLVNSGSAHQDWFHSLYFKVWALGSCIALLAMPLITIFARQEVYKCEAYTFLTGGLASLSLTIWFLPVLWTFPSFIASLKRQDVERPTLIRLTKYHELNTIRVVFRFLFTVPLVILGVDGVRPHQHINDKLFPTDFLGIIAGIGCCVSSAITLVIFFPRSIENEMTQRDQQLTHRRQRAQLAIWNRINARHRRTASDQSYISITRHSKAELDHFKVDPFPSFESTQTHSLGMHQSARVSLPGLPSYDAVAPRQSEGEQEPWPSIKVANLKHSVGPSISLQPNRRTVSGSIELGAVLTHNQVELIRAQSNRDRGVSSLVHHWRSPIDIGRPTVSRWQRQV